MFLEMYVLLVETLLTRHGKSHIVIHPSHVHIPQIYHTQKSHSQNTLILVGICLDPSMLNLV